MSKSENERSNELMTAPEVAERLRVRRSTVYAAAKRNEIPHIRLWQSGRRALIRFRRSDVEQFLKDRTIR